MTDVTLEMLRLLMLDENLLVVELPVAVPEVCAKEIIDNTREVTIIKMFTLHVTHFRRPAILILFLIKLGENKVYYKGYQHHGFDAFFFFLPIATVQYRKLKK